MSWKKRNDLPPILLSVLLRSFPSCIFLFRPFSLTYYLCVLHLSLQVQAATAESAGSGSSSSAGATASASQESVAAYAGEVFSVSSFTLWTHGKENG